MPASWSAAATVFLAAFVGLLVTAGVVSYVIAPLRDLVYRRFIGSIVYMATARTREEARATAQLDLRRRTVLEAVGVIEEALSTGMRYDAKASVQLAQGLSALELHGPPEVAPYLAPIAGTAETTDGEPLNPSAQRALMKPVTDAVRKWEEQTRG